MAFAATPARHLGLTCPPCRQGRRTAWDESARGRLDTSISLRRPSDYVASEGARFEVHIEKGRGLTGDAAKPFEVKLTADPGGRPIWTIHEIADVQKARVEALIADGLSVRDIAEETGIPKSTVHRIKKAMETTNA